MAQRVAQRPLDPVAEGGKRRPQRGRQRSGRLEAEASGVARLQPRKKPGARLREGRPIQNRRLGAPTPPAAPFGLGAGATLDEAPACAAAGASGSPADRAGLCQDILAAGYVQAYVDFFYLTHKAAPASVCSEEEAPEAAVSAADMKFLSDTLIAAEEARRRGDTDLVFRSYEALARHYQGREEPQTGVYFYEKCLEISKLTGDAAAEMKANERLGSSHASAGEHQVARKFHERSLALARGLEDGEAARGAYGRLVGVYEKIADAVEAAGALDDAVEEGERCLEAAKRATDVKAEGDASYRLGRLHTKLGQAEQARRYLESYEATCAQLGDLEGQGKAQAALAKAFDALGDGARCLRCLEGFLETATRTGDMASEAEACRALGTMHHHKGDFGKAVELFDRNFAVCRSIAAAGSGSSALVDEARVFVGVARANATLKRRAFELSHDLSSLVRWELAKVGGAAREAGR